jgi:hypothetical protein
MRLLAVLLVAGCAPNLPAGYTCTVDSQCVSNGTNGVCEPTKACSFPDISCASGKRYGNLGPTPLAGNCVEVLGDGGTGSDGSDGSDGMVPGVIMRVGSSSRPMGAPTGGSVTVTVPAVSPGDLLLVSVVADANNATISAPSGWMQHASLNGAVTGNFRASWFYKFAAGGDSSTPMFTITGATNATAALVAYRNVSMSVVFDASTNAVFQAQALTAPSITTTHPGAMLVTMFVNDTGGGTLMPPSGMSTASATGPIGMFDVLQPIAGPTGDKTASLGIPTPAIGAVDFVALSP